MSSCQDGTDGKFYRWIINVFLHYQLSLTHWLELTKKQWNWCSYWTIHHKYIYKFTQVYRHSSTHPENHWIIEFMQHSFFVWKIMHRSLYKNVTSKSDERKERNMIPQMLNTTICWWIQFIVVDNWWMRLEHVYIKLYRLSAMLFWATNYDQPM